MLYLIDVIDEIVVGEASSKVLGWSSTFSGHLNNASSQAVRTLEAVLMDLLAVLFVDRLELP